MTNFPNFKNFMERNFFVEIRKKIKIFLLIDKTLGNSDVTVF